MDIAIGFAKKHLTGLAEWHVPECGMFLWMRIPQLVDTHKVTMDKSLKKGLLLIPGQSFMTDSTKPSQYIRVSYSNVTEKDLDDGFELLAQLIREEIE